jgi:hypothetical protein
MAPQHPLAFHATENGVFGRLLTVTGAPWRRREDRLEDLLVQSVRQEPQTRANCFEGRDPTRSVPRTLAYIPIFRPVNLAPRHVTSTRAQIIVRSTPNASAYSTPISLPLMFARALTDSRLRMCGVGRSWVA